MTLPSGPRLIETDEFPFEFISQLAERESWRKEIHRPVYHVHKWWAKRLGSVFRGILLGCHLDQSASLADEFYKTHSLSDVTIFDPFMGSGTTVGEAHKLGCRSLGRDINPVAFEAVTTAFGPLNRRQLLNAFHVLEESVGKRIRQLYGSIDRRGQPCEVLYYFWVMRTACPKCARQIDLFPSYVVARNAMPKRKPEVQVLCPKCGDIFPGLHGQESAECSTCHSQFDPRIGTAHGTKAHCPDCNEDFAIVNAVRQRDTRPDFRLYGKLVLTSGGNKEYLAATPDDLAAFERSSVELRSAIARGEIKLPDTLLECGHNTRQAMGYQFKSWKDFFNDRQLLALNWLRNAIETLDDEPTRRAMLTLFSGVLEFNNLFASYKGEGTGAVRHMFSHHILKPERMPIEANVWGTSKSSGSFSNLFPTRLLRAIDYRESPTEVNGRRGSARTCSLAFSGQIESNWPTVDELVPRGIYLSCGDSSNTQLADRSIDWVVTDPPFFDNVHYSELADFFFAWQQKHGLGNAPNVTTTRNSAEVQDADPHDFADKLKNVFRECHRLLKDDGILAFTYHHSRKEGWSSLADAIFGAGFRVVNSQPVRSEMLVATPKSQAKEPIQLDIILVCRKRPDEPPSRPQPDICRIAVEAADRKLNRLHLAGFDLSKNDRRVVVYGQLLALVQSTSDVQSIESRVEECVDGLAPQKMTRPTPVLQKLLFDAE